MRKYLFFYQGENKLDQIKILRFFIISTIIIFCYQYLLIELVKETFSPPINSL